MLYLFNNHFTFYLSYLGMNYSNVIGFLIFIVFLLQFFSGLLLSSYYSPFIGYSSVIFIMYDVNVGWFIRYFHVLGSSLFMLFIMIHWIRGIWIRLKMIEQQLFLFYPFNALINNYCINYIDLIISEWFCFNISIRLNLIWFSGWVIFICSLIDSFLGYILNWGQMSYWGITVMINIFSIIPLIGSYIGEYLWCSSLVILNRIFIVHFSLGFVLGVLIMIHIFLLHSFSSLNPLTNNNSIIIPFYSLVFKDCLFSYVISLLYSFYLFWEPDIFGNCDNLVLANPLATPNHILPEWYFLLFYCCLRAFPNKTMGVIIVILMFLLLV